MTEGDKPLSFGRWSPEALARREVRRIVRHFPQRLDPSGADLTGLAEDLSIAVSRRRELSAGARWRRFREQPPVEPRLWGEEQAIQEVVELRPDMQGQARRYALAHELGHAVLDRRFDGRSTELPTDQQERFAKAFAGELLLSGTGGELREGFRAAQDAPALLRLARSVGAPPGVVLIRADRENWLADSDVLWLDIRTIANLKSGRDRRPRIYHCVRDRKRWFLPRNRSIRGILGDDSWLASTQATLAVTGELDISRSRGRPSKLVHESVPAELTALRLRSATKGFGPEVLAHVRLRTEEG